MDFEVWNETLEYHRPLMIKVRNFQPSKSYSEPKT